MPAQPKLSPAMASRIEAWPIEKLKPYERNARTHSELQLDQLGASIREFGFINPVLVDTDAGVIAGHGRLEAAKRMGLTEVPVVVLDHLTPAQKRAYVIADNKLSDLGGWDVTLLQEELGFIEEDFQMAEPELVSLFEFGAPVTFSTRKAAVEELKDHPRNYKQHPEDQIEHICKSIQENGIYRNVVIARDGTILAGHGVVKAARKMGLSTIPVLQLGLDPDDIKALKLMTADNELSHLGELDDRALSHLLKEILDEDSLLGTGYDEKMLANMLYVTRPASEVADKNEAAEWVGMPEFEPHAEPTKIIVQFDNETDKAKFCDLIGIAYSERKTLSTWWPEKERQDPSSLEFQQAPFGPYDEDETEGMEVEG